MNKQWMIVLASVLITACAVTHSASAGRITFFEGGDGSQDNVGGITTDESCDINFKKSHGRFKNDEARSLRVWYAAPGTIIKVYDDPNGKESDDWAEIRVLSDKDFVVRSFEEDRVSSDYSITYHRKNGLKGKVSHLRITPGYQEPSETTHRARLARELDRIYNAFPHKNGEAHEFTNQDHQYRIYLPTITDGPSGGMVVSTKLDHIRRGHQDDYGVLELEFDSKCELINATSSITLGKDWPWSDAETVSAVKDLADATGDPRAKIAAAGYALAAKLYSGLSAAGETGGQLIFPSVIKEHTNKIGKAVVDTCPTPEKAEPNPNPDPGDVEPRFQRATDVKVRDHRTQRENKQ